MDGGPRFSVVIGFGDAEADSHEKRGASHQHRLGTALAVLVFGGSLMERYFYGAHRFGFVLPILGGSLPWADRLFIFKETAQLEIKAQV